MDDALRGIKYSNFETWLFSPLPKVLATRLYCLYLNPKMYF